MLHVVEHMKVDLLDAPIEAWLHHKIKNVILIQAAYEPKNKGP